MLCVLLLWPSLQPSSLLLPVRSYLDPVTLARCACVGREWRAAATADALWHRHWASLLAELPASSREGHEGPATTGGCCGGGGCSRRFAALAARHPGRLLRWRTNRVLLGRRLGWLPDGQTGSTGSRHIDTAAVLEYLRSGGRRGGAPRSSGGGGSSSSEGSAGEGPLCTSQLKFWQL
jgi:hypothetical protein